MVGVWGNIGDFDWLLYRNLHVTGSGKCIYLLLPVGMRLSTFIMHEETFNRIVKRAKSIPIVLNVQYSVE